MAPEVPLALLTNATHFGGPAALAALQAAGFRALCHDPGFADEAARLEFAEDRPGTVALRATDPAAAVDAALEHGERLAAIVSNDYVAPPADCLGLEAPPAALRELLERLTVDPFRVLAAALGPMRASGGGTIVFLTSAAARRPIAGKPLYTAARAATTSLVQAAAKSLAREGILLFAVGPTFFENPTYFPPRRWDEDPALRARVEREVPLGRLGSPREMEALIGFLLSGQAAPLTGELIGFSGGYLP
ncbi:MAG TPA: SDR family oxidoreductase [Solirubrobacterales bacterium]|nr:SDR family oxidoreductase [Solirubrobacterales bacterium]